MKKLAYPTCPTLLGRILVRLLPTVAFALMAAQAAAQTPRLLEEIQANTYTTASQFAPAVAVADDGGFVVIWASHESPTDSSRSVQGRVFASDGTAMGDQFQANTFTTYSQQEPTLAIEPDGDFLVAWHRFDVLDVSNNSIEGRRYTSSGTPIGDQFQIAEYGNFSSSPDAIHTQDDRFLIAWNGVSSGTGDSTRNIQARFLDSLGLPSGSQFQVNSNTNGNQEEAAIAEGLDGSFLVVWKSRGTSIEARRLTSDGTFIGEQFQIETYATGDQESPRVGVNSAGDFLIVWDSQGSLGDDTSFESIQGQRLSSDGTFLGGQFQINTATEEEQLDPAVFSQGEHWIVVWEGDEDEDTGDRGLRGQRLASDASQLGSEFVISPFELGDSNGPVGAFISETQFIVVSDRVGSLGDDTDRESMQIFRFELTGGVGDRVFLDADFDGVQDEGEAGVEGVDVHLFEASGVLLESTETNDQGDYFFADLDFQELFVEFEAPPAYRFTGQDRGGDDALDSDADPGSGRTVNFTPPVDAAGDTWDAGLTNGLGDRVWLDLDADGLQDGGESGVAGVAVELFDSSGSSVATTTTDQGGRYAFADLVPGTYYLGFTAPEGFSFTIQGQGNDSSVDSDADPVSGETSLIVSSNGDLRLDLDAGLIVETGIELLDGPEPRATGDDFQVNSSTTGFQYNPSAARLEDGSFVIAWQSASSTGDDNDQLSVQLQRFASDGSALGGEQQVNTVTVDTQIRPDVAAAPGGGFWIVWESDTSAGDDTSSDSIQLRRFDSSGVGLGNDLQVNQLTSGAQRSPAIAVGTDGSAIVSWFASFDGSGTSVPARVFDSLGAPVGDEFTVNSYTPSDQYLGDVEALESGDFLVVWSSPTESSGRQIFGRRVGTDGAVIGSEFQLSQDGGSYPTAAATDGDGFLVAWDSGSNTLSRFFDAAGDGLGSEFVVGPSSVFKDISPIAASRFLVTWQSSGSSGDGSSAGIESRLVESPGIAVGAAFQINSYTTGAQQNPRLAADPATGSALITWESDGSPEDDDSGESVLARILQFPAEIGDFVFGDSDFDGLQDPGESGVEGALVGLYDQGGQLIGHTSSDAEGRYGFYPVIDPAIGSLHAFLRFESPDGLSFTTPNAGDDTLDSDPDPATGETEVFQLEGAQVDQTRDAGLGAGIGNRIWLDADGNGIQDGGEAGFPGVTVALLDGGGTPVDQTLSDSSGAYAFSGLESGTYAVQVLAPAGFELTLRDQGNGQGSDAVDSDVSATGLSSTFLYVEGSIDADLDAGLVPEIMASIGDRVWLDANLNGVQDGGEAGFEGIVVELFNSAGVSQRTTMTDAGGSYLFEDLATGDYYLSFSEPAGFCYSAQDQGSDDAADSDVDPQTLVTPVFSIAAGVADPTRDAGLVPDASIGNRAWLDDGDGLQAGGEPGIENVTVNLYDSADTLLDSTTTDASGAYAFSPGPGDYYLEFILPTDMAFAPRGQGGDDAKDSDVFASTGTTAIFALGPGEVDASRDAGLEPAVIGNRVWDDQNADGQQQPGEPGQPGITVRLLDATDTEIATTTTDSDGLYQFLGVASGSYHIEVVSPIDGVFSTQDVGDDDLIDSDVDPSTGRSKLFEYAAASASRSWDAGLRILPLFEDGFESGDISAWSESVP